MSVAIIPARGGSQRIPRKNIRMFHGKPIIAYSIEAAQASNLFHEVIVSTDDQEIMDVAFEHGADCAVRPAELAADSVGTQQVMRYVLSEQLEGASIAACIYPCAPMLDVYTLIKAMALLQQTECSYVVPVATWLSDPGQFYLGRADAFVGGLPLLGTDTRMIPINPERAIDINTEQDWARAEAMYAALHEEKR